MNSAEELPSRSLYVLNNELLQIKNKEKNRRIDANKIKNLCSYLLQGNFKRIWNKASETYGEKQIYNKAYTLKDYPNFPDVKVAVYTCIWGKYDTVHEPLYINPNIDYYLITDQEINSNSAWKPYHLSPEFLEKGLNPIEVNRYCKMLPHLILPNYDYSIYIDGNVIPTTDMMPLIADLGDKVLAVHKYPITDCIYEMGKTIVVGKKARKSDVDNQLNNYQKIGFPAHFGAFECNVLIRKHTSDQCCRLMEDWWEEFSNTPTKRDQLSFPFVLWKNHFSVEGIHDLGPNVRFNPRFQVVNHI